MEIGGYWYTSPAIGGDGSIYVGNGWPKNDTGYLYAINPNGKVRWKIKTDGAIITPPAISKNGTIYVGTDRGIIYAIGGYATHNAENKGNNKWNYIAVIGAIGIVVAGVWMYYFRKRRRMKSEN